MFAAGEKNSVCRSGRSHVVSGGLLGLVLCASVSGVSAFGPLPATFPVVVDDGVHPALEPSSQWEAESFYTGECEEEGSRLLGLSPQAMGVLAGQIGRALSLGTDKPAKLGECQGYPAGNEAGSGVAGPFVFSELAEDEWSEGEQDNLGTFHAIDWEMTCARWIADALTEGDEALIIREGGLQNFLDESRGRCCWREDHNTPQDFHASAVHLAGETYEDVFTQGSWPLKYPVSSVTVPTVTGLRSAEIEIDASTQLQFCGAKFQAREREIICMEAPDSPLCAALSGGERLLASSIDTDDTDLQSNVGGQVTQTKHAELDGKAKSQSPVVQGLVTIIGGVISGVKTLAELDVDLKSLKNAGINSLSPDLGSVGDGITGALNSVGNDIKGATKSVKRVFSSRRRRRIW